MSLLITDAGIAASIQASELGVSYKITHIAMGASGYTPTHNQTSLRDEIVRRPITQGSVPALGQLHFEVVFDGDIEYEAREIGYFLEDGTLFAVDSRGGDIISIKRADTVIIEVFDLTLSGSEINTITVELIGAANATERIAGIAKIATQSQVIEGTDDSAFLTIKKLLQRTASTLRAGVVQLSNLYDGKSEIKAVTEKALSTGLATVYSPDNPQLLSAIGAHTYFTASEYEEINWVLPDDVIGARFVLVKIKTIIQYDRAIKLQTASNWNATLNLVGGHNDSFYFLAANSSNSQGFMQSILIPCVTENKKPTKGMKFTLSRASMNPSVTAPRFEIIIDSAWK